MLEWPGIHPGLAIPALALLSSKAVTAWDWCSGLGSNFGRTLGQRLAMPCHDILAAPHNIAWEGGNRLQETGRETKTERERERQKGVRPRTDCCQRFAMTSEVDFPPHISDAETTADARTHREAPGKYLALG